MTNNITHEEVLKMLENSICDDKKAVDRMTEKYLDLSILSITQIRQWTFTVITLSSAILGFSLSIGINNSLIINRSHAYISLILLVFTIAFALYKLKGCIERDIANLPKQAAALRETMNKIINSKQRILFEQTEATYIELEKAQAESINKITELLGDQPKPIYDYDIIMLLFTEALIFIILSIIDFNFLAHFIY